MLLAVPAIMSLVATCAPMAAPATLTAIVLTESGGDPLAIGVNGPKPYRIHPRDMADAIRTADGLLAKGMNVDLGLGQINSRNMASLGLSAAEAFDPCRNLAASARVLAADYGASGPVVDIQAALRTSLSLYNTGDPTRGFRNGYVAKVVAAARVVVPALDPGVPGPVTTESASALSAPPSWDVFARRAPVAASFVIQPPHTGQIQ